MSANRAPHLSQLVRAPTPDPAEAEKASLREQLAAASAGLVAEAKCVPDDREDMWEEKTTWLRRWEEKMAVLMPLVERGKALGVSMRVDAEDAPALAEADDWYERWTTEEAEARAKAEQDIQMGEETAAEVGNEGAGLKMSHVEVPQLARKHLRQTIAESEDEAGPRVTILPGSVLHKVPCARCLVKNAVCFGLEGRTCDGCIRMKQGCEKLTKAAGKRAQAGTSIARSLKAPKAGPSKQAHDDDDDDIVEVVESRTRGKGKTSGCSTVSNKTVTDLSQALAMVRAEAVATHAANLRLQVHIEQLAEALAEHGIE
ncbi:hypothetical protein M404DRAFT_28930 [Pisolithus tinctorius Marx 270]|uniref:Uncharacterized protein n=1 Tax=Pisolithus tinctorius Marx 270 TaxID=870435 RepID=A0A0C3NJP5_PISTI|nr:hypothetical protein M404DRAFT_28930 [Pisolithus tinctorius Marx 270]